MRILAVGKDGLQPDEIQYLADMAGIEVQVVEKANNALTRLAQGEFDLVFVDLSLPDMKGSELIHKLKELQPNVKIVAITEFTSRELERAVRKEGVIYYMIKPTNRNELMDIITFQASKKQPEK